MNFKWLKFTAMLVVWILILASSLAAYSWHWLNATHFPQQDSFVYKVEKGSSLYKVAADLNERGFMHWPKLWVAYARVTEQSNIKSGEFQIRGNESPVELLKIFNSAKVISYSVTLVEGLRFEDYLNKLQQQEKLIKKLDPNEPLTQLAIAGADVNHLEGWFFPDTYQYIAGDSDLDILIRAHEKMKLVLADEWAKRQDALPYSNAYEALIMASIVEKETGVAYERDQIAGVFVRRLQRGMRLQTDPTVIYGMGKSYTGNITRKDLRTPTPYNTYVIKGLPPTPIAMPGREAIHAALHPADGETLYFVAKGDGTHHFSATNEEHINAVNKYQKRRREDYRSSPVEPVKKEEKELP